MMTEARPALRLHSMMLGVRDVERSVKFYREMLGFTLGGRFAGFALLESDGLRLTLRETPLEALRRGERFPIEIVLAVDGVRDAYERLRSSGVTFFNEPHTIDGTNDVANFEDPDGHLFSLYGPP